MARFKRIWSWKCDSNEGSQEQLDDHLRINFLAWNLTFVHMLPYVSFTAVLLKSACPLIIHSEYRGVQDVTLIKLLVAYLCAYPHPQFGCHLGDEYRR